MGGSMFHRTPRPVLRPFVQSLWASGTTAERGVTERELVLPTPVARVVLRLSDDAPLHVFTDAHDPVGRTVSRAVLGGARTRPYLRATSRPLRSVGAQLRPGAAELLTGIPAHELAERHTPLEDIFGRAAEELRERLSGIDSAERQLDVFEDFLAARISARGRGVDPTIARAIERLATSPDVGAAVEESGFSHRKLIETFRRAVGLTPKVYCRLLRFQRALDHFAANPRARAIDVALDAGYSDQPHLNREFKDLTGLSPGEYRVIAPRAAQHVPVGLLHGSRKIHPRRERLRA
jgi:AraC-like DNA-binding protein